MPTISNAQLIKLYRVKVLRGALKLEIVGLKRGGRSAYSIVKEEFGFKGNKKRVLEQLENWITINEQEEGVNITGIMEI
tara:strand:- start:660 stop:896 length:237 start_codon:yes stop_codon:yes gene_type:complete